MSGSLDVVNEIHVAFDRCRRLIVDMLRRADGFDVPAPKRASYAYPSVERLLGHKIRGRVANMLGKSADLVLNEAEVVMVLGEAFSPSGFLRFFYVLVDDDLVEGVARVRELFAWYTSRPSGQHRRPPLGRSSSPTDTRSTAGATSTCTPRSPTPIMTSSTMTTRTTEPLRAPAPVRTRAR